MSKCKNQRSRDFCVTIYNNFELALTDLSFDVEEGRVKYFVMGREICSTTSKEHLQGYIYYVNARTFSAVKKDFPTAHIESTKGTPKSASDYCKKGEQSHEEWDELGTSGSNYGKNAKFVEKGELPQQGARSDLENVREVLNTTGRMSDVVQVATSYQSVRMAEAILKYHEKGRDWKPYVRWFYGATGTGKSKEAYELLGDDCYTCLSTGKWFEGYDAHENVIIDDMRKDFMKFHELLRLLDRYQMRVECKGGSRQFVARNIIITSAYHPAKMFDTREDIKQLLRRIDEIKMFEDMALDEVAEGAPPP